MKVSVCLEVLMKRMISQQIEGICSVILVIRYNNLIYIVTVFQAIFLPLQAITAIYGMNFDIMPVFFLLIVVI